MAVAKVDIPSPRSTGDHMAPDTPCDVQTAQSTAMGLKRPPGGQAVGAKAWGHWLVIRETRRQRAGLGAQGMEGDVTTQVCDAHSPFGQEVRKPEAGGAEARRSRSGWIYRVKSRPGAVILGLECLGKVDPGQRK